MRESLRFLAAFLRRPGSVGSVLPSSAALSRAMVVTAPLLTWVIFVVFVEAH